MTRKRASTGEVLRAFLASARDHWKELVGGSFLAILIGVALTLGLNIPPFVAGAIAFGLAVLLACFLAFRDQYWKVQELRQEFMEFRDATANEELRQARECFRKAASLIKEGEIPFHALCKSGVHLLESRSPNDLVLGVVADLVSYGNGNPFGGLDEYVRESEYHGFLTWIHWNPQFDPLKDVDYLDAADAWRIKMKRPEPSEGGRLALVAARSFHMSPPDVSRKGLKVSVDIRPEPISNIVNRTLIKTATQLSVRLTFINTGKVLRTIRNVEFVCAMPDQKVIVLNLLGATRYEDGKDSDSSAPLPISPNGQEMIASYRTFINEPNPYEENGAEFGISIQTSDGKGGSPYDRRIMGLTVQKSADGKVTYAGKRLENISLEKES